MPRLEKTPVVVIGAGLAGLGAALRLTRMGADVFLLEASDVAGGCCSTTTVDGFTFNNGAIYVAVPSLLRSAFRRLELDLDETAPLERIRRPLAARLESGLTVHLADSDTSWVEGGTADQTRCLRDGLARLQADWGPIYRALTKDVLPHEPSLPVMLMRLWRYLPRISGRADRLIARYFDDDDLRAAVASSLLYTGLPPNRLPATQIIGLLALLEEGFHLPRGGMGAIGDVLLGALQQTPAELRFGCQVRQILIRNGAVLGVELSSGERIAASHVIATCSGFETVRHLLAADATSRGLARKARTAPLSHRAVSIQIGCSGIAPPETFITCHVPPMSRHAEMHVSQAEEPRWLAYTAPAAARPELAPPGASVIELHAPVTGIGHASEWTDSMTDAVLSGYMAALRRRMPDLSVETLRVTDPRSFVQDRHLHEGALYGMAPGVPPNRFFPHRTSLAGLYLGGQTTFPGYGVALALLSGIQAAEALLRDQGVDAGRS
ncbi:MAG: NAD(P)/FAD-dependent oxidoreductase [Paracoccus sp. (in: a-proteobacteria)]|nr:NAD(P)/FAD-dependent oxidoreductase [Paracoccus sp. (in: a-proteobacteria)]